MHPKDSFVGQYFHHWHEARCTSASSFAQVKSGGKEMVISADLRFFGANMHTTEPEGMSVELV